MKKRNLSIASAMILSSLMAVLFLLKPESSFRDQYESFILKKAAVLKHTENITEQELKSPDKPDEAAFLEYVKTVDPALGYVPKERLWKAYQYTEAKIDEQKALREYDPNITWEKTGANMGGRTRMMMFDPNDSSHKKVWAGGVTGGLWYTNDITNTNDEWTPVGDFWSNLAISCMAYDPVDPQVLYVGTGEAQTARIIYRESSGVGAGIFKSNDGGENWELLDSTSGFKYITDIAVRNEDGTGVIYAGVASGTYQGIDHESMPSDGLYRSADGGMNWEQVLPLIPGVSNTTYTPADIEVTANGRIFVGTMENLNGQGGATVLFSDEGTSGSWIIYDYYNAKIKTDNKYNKPARTILAVAPSNPDRIYAQFAAGYDDVPFILYKGRYIATSNDAGVNWTQLNLPDSDWSTLAWHAFDLKVDPSDENSVFTGGLDLWKSSNTGNNWNHISDWSLMYYGGGNEYVHADQHNIQYMPGLPATAIFSSDGGVFLTNTANQNYPIFIERNQGYNTLQFYTCAISPTTGAEKYLGGLQDNGTLYYNGSPLDINDMVDGGDGAYCFWDQNEASIFITSVYYNQYSGWYNGNWQSYVDGINNNHRTGTFVSPADYDYKNNILYSNGVTFDGSFKNNIYKVSGIPTNMYGQLVNLGTDSDLPFSAITYSKFSPFGTATLFVGTQSGKLYKVTNAQIFPNAEEIGTSDFPTANISCIALGSSEDIILVTFSNYGVSSVWLTQDGGVTWMEKESNLPDMPVRWALFHPDNDDQALLATETGIWATNTLFEEETEWSPANDGLANVRVDMLRIRQADDVVLAATHGRGLATAVYNLDVYTGYQENSQQFSNLKIFPNPAYEKCTMTLRVQKGQKITGNLTDISGKLIDGWNEIADQEQYKKDLDLSDLAGGTYFIHIETNGKSETGKLIIR